MKWANALSTRPSLEGAVFEVVERSQQLLSAPADLGFVFISSAFASEYSRLMPLLQQQLGVPVLIGCSGSGIIGMDGQLAARELEEQPALSLTLACLPGVKVEAFHLHGEELPDLDSPPDAWVETIGVPASSHPHFILLADPFTSKINDLLQGLDFAYPGSAKVGGLASGGAMGNTIALFSGDRLYREGAVGVALSGNIVLETIVAQGCKPIGHPFTVKECERNILLALDAEPCGSGVSQRPLEALKTVIESLSESDRQLAQHSLFIGIARNEFKEELEQGDFLIRNVLGVDPREGAIAIGDRLRPGQRIQFHLRDAQTSAEDLEMLLQRYQSNFSAANSSVGALMFACLGRGEQLYGEPDFDSRLFRQYVGNIPVSGFFCNGEIGPVGGGTFLHGYTSVFGICHPL
ncbi:FIST signal transduction protein [Laspinema olomoucense]|uniref:FIST C-terminal domain-containing protein n=1 Tax=Laspinema olomoucense D3b TaxID=2953688 RepID=A0ABT2ND85_9CYAN|nr:MULTISPECIES: FIST N-terminal domain-containing protein [unclassified Laspinema]MCT7971822.1 FIST C-terminal domain-containing protein [Laspinema sp. D3d]MCT7979725.1 FIST C-terminal domain-containing protein [Laspinema sp. D3b]MCT7989100.1 FIST C-terminal domain-containing protein [Laspinema sp. D3a]MCT7993426.1 FIST C-terminal domain-containing protein [Laspinema sp. D3c]